MVLKCIKLCLLLIFITRLMEQLPSRALPWEITTHLQQIVKDTLATIPIIESMKQESFRERHWKQLLRLAGV